MNKKPPPELPNIEDATLRACLAPLMGAMSAGSEPLSQTATPAPTEAPVPAAQWDEAAARVRPAPSGSNDNPLPSPDDGKPKTLADWRLQADDEFAAFRMVELFLAMSDAELIAAAAEFPRQLTGTVARLGQIKQRLAAQYDKVTAVVALLERARLRASAESETD